MPTYEKNIFVRKDLPAENGKFACNVHILQGYNQKTISDYEEMLKEIQKDFPLADKTNVNCDQVTKSSYNFGFTLLRYYAHIDKKLLEKDGILVSSWKDWNVSDKISHYCF